MAAVAHGFDDGKCRVYGTLRIVLVCQRVAEIRQYAVSQIARNKAVERSDRFAAGALILADQVRQSLGVDLSGKGVEPTKSQNTTER